MTTPPRSKTTAAIPLIDAYDTPGGALGDTERAIHVLDPEDKIVELACFDESLR